MPSSPGDEFTSSTLRPVAWSPACPRRRRASPMICAAWIAVRSNAASSCTASARAPRCTLARNSSPTADRRMAATTCRRPRRRGCRGRGSRSRISGSARSAGALQGLDDRLGNLGGVGQDHADTLGALEQLDDHRRAAELLDRRQVRRCASARKRSAECRSLCRLRTWIERNLSRETAIACDELSVNTPICSNCRTTAVPKKLTDAPIRGMTAS